MNDVAFFRQFDDKMKSMGEFTLADLFSAVMHNKLAVYNTSGQKTHLKSNFAMIEEFNKTIFHIRAIMDKPKTHIKLIKGLSYSDLANRVDPDCFYDTVKDSRLWNIERERISPMLVYNNFQEDDITIYENKFIKALIDIMFEHVQRKILLMTRDINALTYVLGNTPIGYDKTEIFNDVMLTEDKEIDEKKLEERAVLVPSGDMVSDLYKRINILKVRLNKLRSTEFYKNCNLEKNIDLFNLAATKIMMEETHYRICYQQWQKIKDDNSLYLYYGKPNYNQKIFANFATTKLLVAFLKEKYIIKGGNKRIKYSDGNLVVDNLKLMKNNVYYTFNTLVGGNLLIDMELKNRNYISKGENDCIDKKVKSRIVIKYVSQFAKEDNPQMITEKLAKKARLEIEKGGVDNCFILTPNTEIINTSHVYTLSPNSKLLDDNLNKIIKATLILLQGDAYIYSVKCPICGARSSVTNDIKYICSTCNSSWTILTYGDENKSNDLLWIKNIAK